MRLKVAVLLAAGVVALAGCSDNNKVGSGVNLDVKSAAGQGAIRGSTTTTASVSTTVPSQSGALGKTTTTPPTTAPATSAPPTTQIPAFDIEINGDGAGTSQFDPSQGRVYAGTIVKWTNKDSQPRSVEADDGAWDSGMLQPGQSFTYKADKTGRFNYHDGTRPYAVASLEVLSR